MSRRVLLQGSAAARAFLHGLLESAPSSELVPCDRAGSDSVAEVVLDFACVVIAHELSEVDAVALLGELRGEAALPPVQVIVITSEVAALERAALRAGAMEVVERDGLTSTLLTRWIERGFERFSVLERAYAAAHVNERESVAAALRRTELRMGRLFETNLLGILIWDLAGSVHDANDEFLRIVGYGREDLLRGKIDWVAMTPPEYRESDARALEELRRTGAHAPIEKEFVRKDGARIWILVGSALLEGTSGIGFVLDLSARKRVEQERECLVEELRAAVESSESHQAQLEAVIEALADGVVVFDMQGRVVMLNTAEARITGFASAQDMMRDLPFFADVYQLWSEEGKLLPVGDWPVSRVMRGETIGELSLRTVRTDIGLERFINFSGAPVLDASGKQLLSVIVSRDVTSDKRSQDALRESEARARAAAAQAESERRLLDATLEAAPVGIIVADARGRLLRMNPANHQLWGDAPHSASNSEYEDWQGWWADGSERHGRRLAPEDWAMARALRGETVRSDIVEIARFGTPSARRIILNSAAPVRDGAGQIGGAVVAQLDITDRMEVEAALRESEQRFSTLANHIPQLAWMSDQTGAEIWFNRRWYEYTGITAEEVRIQGWHRVVHPEHRERVRSKFARCFERCEAWEDTFPLRSKEGEYRWFLSRAMPVHEDVARRVRWFGTNTDIEEQRRQAAALEEAIRVRDAFVQVAAHELRTPLTALALQLEGLRRLYASGPIEVSRALRKVQMAHRQTARLGMLIEALLDVSRIRGEGLRLDLAPLDLSKLVLDTVEGAAELAERAGCELRVTTRGIATGIWDRARLEQALTNLLTNAIKYGPGAAVEIAVEADGDWVELRVRDHGIGIASADQQRIFERFERAVSSAHYGGLGLGLYITREIVQAHGGSVQVESVPGEGATFVVRLPVRAGAHREARIGGDSAERLS